MAAHQVSSSLGFSRQEHWSGLPFPSPMHESENWKWSRSDVSDSLRPHGLQPTRLLYPWDFPSKSTGVGCHRLSVQFSSLQFSRSVVSDSLQPHESQHARPPCPSPTPGVHSNSHPSSQWCHPAISFCCPLFLLPLIPPSIRVSPNESTLHMRWPKYWSFSFSIIPSKEHPGLISFRMDWLDLLAVQGTLKSRLQHHSSKASILQCSAFFMVQLSHAYMTTGKTTAQEYWSG